MTEVQDNYRRIASGFDAVISGVVPEQWSAQSPCEEWSARDVVAHVVGGHRGVIAGIRGEPSEPLRDDEDPVQAWKDASRTLDELTGDPEVLATEVDGPVGKMPA